MIRRGLQFILVGIITALGAAPVFGQYAHWPVALTMSGWPQMNDGTDLNGYWVATAYTSAGYEYVKFNEGNSMTWSVALFYFPSNGNVQWRVGTNVFSPSYTQTFSGYGNNPAPNGTSFTGGSPSAIGASIIPHTNADPYSEAFPDWESAAVKIPLGFGFAMAFWAAAVALSISMRWVRDLASVAT